MGTQNNTKGGAMSLSLGSLQAAKVGLEEAEERLRREAGPWEQRVRDKGFPYARFVRIEQGQDSLAETTLVRFFVGNHGGEITVRAEELRYESEPFIPRHRDPAQEKKKLEQSIRQLTGERDREATERQLEVERKDGWRKRAQYFEHLLPEVQQDHTWAATLTYPVTDMGGDATVSDVIEQIKETSFERGRLIGRSDG
jgi:hypothetical protein